MSATYAAWNAGDWGLERFHPQVEWDLAALDQARPGRGRDVLLHYWRRFWGAWKPGARWEIEELLSLGDEQVLACGRLRAVGRSSGVETSRPIFQLWTVREGLIVRLLVRDDRASALKERVRERRRSSTSMKTGMRRKIVRDALLVARSGSAGAVSYRDGRLKPSWCARSSRAP